PRDRTQLGASNATLLMLVRNSELSDALHSIRQIEDRFNRHYRYPWTFLNDEEFTEEFRLYTSIMVSGEVRYGRVDGEEWGRGEGVREESVRMGMERLEQEGVVYARSESYRNMCRWFAGRFMWHEAVRGFEWYWRVEPNIRYPCDLLYDPFDFLSTHHKSFSFTITLPDYPSTLRSLLPTLQSFFRLHPTLLHPNATTSLLPFILENPELRLSPTPGPNTTTSPLTFLLHPSTTPTYCHFWSNFELGPLSFFRSASYTALFAFLDATGNFHHERWGDAPVHTAAVATLLGAQEVHFWEDMGYWHSPLGRCPWDEESWGNGRCAGCEWVGEGSADWGGGSGGCLKRWWETVGMGGWWEEFSRFEGELGGL
ncbi:nucleotide-diphospho-sugar transferase, partial [Ascodesmis nigricans]